MKTTGGLISAFVVLLLCGVIGTMPAHAIASDVYFAINDTVVAQGPGTGGLPIAGTYTVGAITVTIANSGGVAVIEYDESSDWLRMKYARITSSTTPLDNVKFSFWRTFDTLRTGTATYSISGSGFFTRSTSSADPIDWISARGEVEGTVLGSGAPDNVTSPPPNPPDCAKKLTACATHSPATWQFGLNMPNGGFKVSHGFGSGGKPALGAGSDDLKAEFWIHLEKITDSLDITGSPGIRIKYGPPGGEDRGDCDGNKSCPFGTKKECKCVRNPLPPINPQPDTKKK